MKLTKGAKDILKISGNVLALSLTFTILFTVLGYDTNDWNGIDEEEDMTLCQKIFNRFYFSIISVSTIGFGDISPKTKKLRLAMILYSFFIILHIYDLFT
tara:strand:+ start:1005 stop:1304 length:300 start_codon:yes stop_codon:yes gene_type:complete